LFHLLSSNAYTAYIIHGVAITVIALAVRDVALYPLLKCALVALVAVPLCFGLSSLIRKLPYTDRVL
jgi:surface polysaccharide O-acyltransferase-like enzyme